jgi:hypothetical protein
MSSFAANIMWESVDFDAQEMPEGERHAVYLAEERMMFATIAVAVFGS